MLHQVLHQVPTLELRSVQQGKASRIYTSERTSSTRRFLEESSERKRTIDITHFLFFSHFFSFLLTWMLEYWNTSLSTTMTLEDSNDIPPSSLKPPILKQQPHHLLTSGYQQNIKKYKLSTFELFHHKMADALTTSSRSFYERSKAKLGLSIVLGAASMMLLGFSSGSGGLVSYCQPCLSFHWPLGSVNVFRIKAFLHIRLECI